MSVKHQPPAFLFATVGLKKGSGGIAELSRQVLKTLLYMHDKELIRLEVHVLEGAAPQAGDELFATEYLPRVHWYAGNRWKFALSLIAAKPDVLLLDHIGLGRLPGLMPLVLRRKYLLLIHGVEIWNCTRADYLRTAKNASLLIANSHYTAQKVQAQFPDFPPIEVCWPGKDKVQPGSEYPVDNNPVTNRKIGPQAMLIVGRLSAEQRHKGHDHLIEAMPLILQAAPDAQLVIVGEGDDQKRLQAKALELGVDANIIFTGWVSEAQLSDLYSQAALFVMPSEGDGFGIVFLEAMMHKLPCVGLRQGAAAEIFENGKSGILVDRENRQAMADQLCKLLLDEEQRMQLGNAGFDRYQSAFQESHYSGRMRSILVSHLEQAA